MSNQPESPLSEKELQKIRDMWKKSSEEEKALLRALLGQMDDMMQVAHLFKGGHLMLEDNGEIHRQMSAMKSRMDRSKSSSHQSDSPQYSIQGHLFKEALAGTRTRHDKKYTWLQLEGHPVNSFTNLILHLLDFLKYKWYGKNVGPYGMSEFTERKPLILTKLPPEHNSAAKEKERAEFWEDLLFVHPEKVATAEREQLESLQVRKPEGSSLYRFEQEQERSGKRSAEEPKDELEQEPMIDKPKTKK